MIFVYILTVHIRFKKSSTVISIDYLMNIINDLPSDKEL